MHAQCDLPKGELGQGQFILEIPHKCKFLNEFTELAKHFAKKCSWFRMANSLPVL